MHSSVTLSVQRSRGLLALLGVAHAGAAFALWQIELPIGPLLIFWLVLAASLIVTAKRSHQTSSLTLRRDGRLSILDLSGTSSDGQVSPATTVFPWLIVMLVKTGKRSQSLVLPVDSLGKDGHRQLRLWLRWKTNVEPA